MTGARLKTSRRKGHANPAGVLRVQMRAADLPPFEEEHKFHPLRRWRLDYAWPELRLAVEVEGAVHGQRCGKCGKTLAGGGHTRGAGFVKDCEKYNAAAVLGWTVLRVHRDSIDDGTALNDIEAAIQGIRGGVRNYG